MIVDNKWLKHKTLCNKRLLLTGKVCRTFLAEESVVGKRGMFFCGGFCSIPISSLYARVLEVVVRLVVGWTMLQGKPGLVDSLYKCLQRDHPSQGSKGHALKRLHEFCLGCTFSVNPLVTNIA